MLIGSLVRLPDNHLHVAESERVLKQEDYFQELVELYNSKGHHNKGKVVGGLGWPGWPGWWVASFLGPPMSKTGA